MNFVIDFSNPQEKAIYIKHVRTLEGRKRIEETAYRPRRSDRANRYYWPCFVEPFADWLAEQWGVPMRPEDAHEILKAKFLVQRATNPETGESLAYVGSSAALDTAGFNLYLDRVADFLADNCGLKVPEPNVYRERERQTA